MELEEQATQALEAEHAKFVELGDKEAAEKKALEVAEATAKSQEAKLEHAKADAAAADASHRQYEIELANAIREGKSDQAVADAELRAANQRTIAARRREASAKLLAEWNREQGAAAQRQLHQLYGVQYTDGYGHNVY
mgnify:CR=1 FL=1|tara:strand:+ start:972 stop:1385 length:414 start_codon:yes stop_codon:yes gene_type:complete